ncbi:DUF2235 domain-containing protein [Mesobacterium sp. TK19101]|uniref:DUF2235 domain-containing protein n=1 Tax=Mesobacterium hydrothermale TaxID=3111907 RepID=A0ABU6HL61_9RHOB|nr:DUF2235 domain-containing protein [Mesobacterium sp. TK19101]MEC3863190.1 DUF2235 domain-containing protein [Mesobacterium sp. TK19101]
MTLRDTVLGWIRRSFTTGQSQLTVRRGQRDHVIILDGTMSSLKPGEETNAGLTYRLLQEVPGLSLFYEAGVQWDSWRSTPDVIMGRGINRQIRRAYGFLASRYRPGDRIFLMGYSRGGFAVRSLAGMIDRIGLLRSEKATERNIRQIYRLYQFAPESDTAHAFAKGRCHATAKIEAVCVWDSVKALGLRLPILWRFHDDMHAFHNSELGPTIRRGFHALALDETRRAFAPVLWTSPPGFSGRVEQMWFKGTHGDIGGHIGHLTASRPLSNIPLVWMLERLHTCGIALPRDWRDRFPCDPAAPSVGTWTGLGKLFVLRRARRWGADSSEYLHPSVPETHPAARTLTRRKRQDLSITTE